MKQLIIFLVVPIVFYGCNDMYCGETEYVEIINHSKDTIMVFAKVNPSDTLLSNSLLDYQCDNCVAPNTSSYKLVLDYELIKDNDSVIFFIIHRQTFYNYSWKQIKDNNLISARYLLKEYEIGSFQYLKIPYPPDYMMSGMNIYYKE